MRTARWVCVLLLAACCAPALPQRPTQEYGHGPTWSWVPYDPATMRFGLTPAQAAARVRTWMQNPDLRLQLVGVASKPYGEALQQTPWPAYDENLLYMFDGSDGKRYFVTIHPWLRITCYDDAAASVPDDRAAALPRERRNEIAETFFRDRTPNLLVEDRIPTRAQGTAALFGGVVHHGRYISAWVHPSTGQIEFCDMADTGTPSLSPVPTLTDQDAYQQALRVLRHLAPGYRRFAPAPSIGEPRLFILPDFYTLSHRLIWEVPIAATGDDPSDRYAFWHSHEVQVDAHTGEVVEVEEYLGGAEPSKAKRRGGARRAGLPAPARPLTLRLAGRTIETSNPPLGIGRSAYLWVGWLRSPALAGRPMTVTLCGAQIEMRRGSERWTATIGGKALRQGARALRLSAPVLNRNGRVYLPAEAFRALLGMSVQVRADGVELKTR